MGPGGESPAPPPRRPRPTRRNGPGIAAQGDSSSATVGRPRGKASPATSPREPAALIHDPRSDVPMPPPPPTGGTSTAGRDVSRRSWPAVGGAETIDCCGRSGASAGSTLVRVQSQGRTSTPGRRSQHPRCDPEPGPRRDPVPRSRTPAPAPREIRPDRPGPAARTVADRAHPGRGPLAETTDQNQPAT
jgi:hypothetical protein